MSIMLGKYYFKGPYSSLHKLDNSPGLYAIHCQENEQQILDVGEADQIKNKIKTHERMKCWLYHSQEKGIAVSAYYTDDWTTEERQNAALELRKRYSPPCGNNNDQKIY